MTEMGLCQICSGSDSPWELGLYQPKESTDRPAWNFKATHGNSFTSGRTAGRAQGFPDSRHGCPLLKSKLGEQQVCRAAAAIPVGPARC